jgi:3-oxoadipate enol-lactonase
MSVTNAGDLSVYYEIKGAGPKVIYIAGTSGDLRRKATGLTTPLVDNFKVLTYDLSGLGQTDKPDIAYTMEDYANDAAGLLDLLGWENCHVIGVSYDCTGISTSASLKSLPSGLGVLFCRWRWWFFISFA